MPEALISRTVAPLGSAHMDMPGLVRGWLPKQEDAKTMIERMFTGWVNSVAESEALFQQYVYDNADLNVGDIRQHRAITCGLISDGDLIYIQIHQLILATKDDENAPHKELLAYAEVLDQKLKKLMDTLLSWHAPLASQTDIPESFKQAAREVAAGKLEDM
jgi:hypothetical protein